MNKDSLLAPTPAQSRVLEFIRAWFADHGSSPSFEEISLALGKSMGTVSKHLDSLEARGWLRRTPQRCRSIVLTGGRCPCCGRACTQALDSSAPQT